MFRYPSGGPFGLVAVVAAVGLLGCAPAPPPKLPSETERAGFGTVGVVAARFPPQDMHLTDAVIGKDAGAAGGAGKGAQNGARKAWDEGRDILNDLPPELRPIGLVIIPLFVVVGAAIGATVGAIDGAEQAIAKDAAEEIRVCISEVLMTPQIQRNARNRVLAVAIRETSRSFVAINDQGPFVPQAPIGYRSLADRGIDTVLEVSILKAGLAGGRGDHLDLQAFFLAQVRVVRVADDSEIFRREGWYGTEYHPLHKLCADNGRVLQAALEGVYANMADAIVEEVFLLWRPGDED